MANSARQADHCPPQTDQEDSGAGPGRDDRTASSDVGLLEATNADAERVARIFYDAFGSIAARHNLLVEPSSPEFTRLKVGEMLADDGFAGFVAEVWLRLAHRRARRRGSGAP
jgi:hypothetical protein